MRALIERTLKQPVSSIRPVAGGDINEAYAVALQSGARVFVKTRAKAPAVLYECEAEGLAWLAEAEALPVPRVIAVTPRLLALEWLEPAPRRADFDVQLGRGLAKLHRHGAPSFGLDSDNFIGLLPQPNAPKPSFSAFYAEQRLLPLVARARAGGLLDKALARRFERLCQRLPARLGEAEPPARLHGDLWSGNVHTGPRGEPVLIDPAVYGGHREVDLAMLQLFGGPSARFFAAYDEVYPRAAGFEERVPLFQLYPLLVHLCLFGAGYLGPLTHALSRCE